MTHQCNTVFLLNIKQTQKKRYHNENAKISGQSTNDTGVYKVEKWEKGTGVLISQEKVLKRVVISAGLCT